MRIGDGGGTPAGPAGPGGAGGLGDPLAGLQMPPGDPGLLGGATGQLSKWASELGSGAANHHQAASSVIGSAWIGPAAQAAGKSVQQIAQGAATMADAASHASTILGNSQRSWQDAVVKFQQAQGLAQQAMADEAAHRQQGAAAAAAMNPAAQAANPAGFAKAQSIANGGDGYQSPQRAQAIQLGQEAVDEANIAINTASAMLTDICGAVKFMGTAPDPHKDGAVSKTLDALEHHVTSLLSWSNTAVTMPAAIAKAKLDKAIGEVQRTAEDMAKADGEGDTVGKTVSSLANLVRQKDYYKALEDLGNKSRVTQALSSTVGDLAKGGSVAGDLAKGDSAAGALGKVADIGGKIPVVGGLLTVASAITEIKGGMSPGKAIGGSAAGLGSGMAAAEGTAFVVGAMGGPIGLGVAVGAVAAIGVGYAVQNIIQHGWGGFEKGVASDAKQVAHAAEDVGKGIVHGAEGLASDLGL